MAFDIQVEKRGKKLFITLTGRLDSAAAAVFHETLASSLTKEIISIVFYVKELEYISSAAIRVFLFSKQRMGPGNEIFLIEAQPFVVETIKSVGLHHSLRLERSYEKEEKGKIGILIEEYFDPISYLRFEDFFPSQGYKIEYLSHLWGHSSLTFASLPDKAEHICHEVTVEKEVEQADPKEYRAILLTGGYAMDRLRYEACPQKNRENHAPGVVFIRTACHTEGLVIGTICHGLWLFCAAPELVKGRKVTCAHNIIPDVENAGGLIQYDEHEGTKAVVVDGNLITGRHPGVVDPFLDTLNNILKIS